MKTGDQGYWDGALWVYHADITNNGSNSGNHTYAVVPGAGNEMEVLYGLILNGDASNRTAGVLIKDGAGGNIISRILSSFTLNAGISHAYPVADERSATGAGINAGARIIIGGTIELSATFASIAVSQDTAFAIVCRIRGGLPTVTLTSPTDAVEVVNTNQVF